MQVWLYDENKIYIKTIRVEELGENMTTISPLSNGNTGSIPYRPRFDEENQVWVEDMTESEIESWKNSRQEKKNIDKDALLIQLLVDKL